MSTLSIETAPPSLLAERARPWSVIAREQYPPLQWSVKGLIPEGLGLLVAPPKAGKSWFVLDLAIACSTGNRALGAIQVAPRPVLYLALEDGYRRLQTRLNVLAQRSGTPPSELLQLVTRATTAETWQLIGDFLEDCDCAPLVILDTIGRVLPPKQHGENEYQRDYGFTTRLKNCVDSVPGATLLGVHHTNKGIHQDFMNSVSGTQGLNGGVDFSLVLDRRRHSDSAVLSVTGREVEESQYALLFDSGQWLLDGDTLEQARGRAGAVLAREREAATRARVGDKMTSVVDYVNSAGQPVTPGDVANACGIDSKAASTYLSRAVESGLVDKQGRGRYAAKEVVEFNTFNTTVEMGSASFTPHEQGKQVNSTLSTLSTVSSEVDSVEVDSLFPVPDTACVICGDAVDPESVLPLCALKEESHNEARKEYKELGCIPAYLTKNKQTWRPN